MPLGGDHEGGYMLALRNPHARRSEESSEMARWQLTARQTEVLGLVTQGLTNKEVADALRCAEVTVEKHVTALLRRLGVASRTALAARALARAAQESRWPPRPSTGPSRPRG